jgi:hypothetical protein
MLTDGLTPEKLLGIRAARMKGIRYGTLQELRQVIQDIALKHSKTMVFCILKQGRLILVRHKCV